MNIEKIGPLPPEKGKQKISEESEPDSDAFKEMMKIGQTPDVDLDEQSARKFSQPIEEEEEEPASQAPSSSDIYYYKKQTEEAPSNDSEKEINEPKMKGKTSPQSPEFYAETSKKKLSPELKNLGYLVDKELKNVKNKHPKEAIFPKTKTLAKETKETGKKQELAHERVLSEKAKGIKEAEFHAQKIKAEELNKAKHLEEVKKQKPAKAEKVKKETKTPEKKEEISPQKEKKLPEKKEETATSLYQTLQLSEATQARAEAIIAKEPSQLNPEIVPMLEHMIGTLLQFSNKGISETQIILNNKQFENSRFYNSKIIFEKYAIAPNSYNIKLTGSQEAVSIFNENIEGLYKKLAQADLEFEIGQLSAEYERPLFKRKPSIGEFDRDTQSR